MKWRILIAATLLIGAPAAADEYIVTAAKVYTMTGEPLSPGAVRIRDGKIVEVAQRLDAPAGARVVDLGAGVLLPGFVDAYTNYGLEGGLSESTREVTPTFQTVHAIDWSAKVFRQVRGEGVTTVAVMPGTDNVVAGLSCVVKTAGPSKSRVVSRDQALVVTMASDPASGNSSRNRPDTMYVRQPTNRMGVVWMLRQEFAQARGSSPIAAALERKRPVICISRADVDITAALRLKKEYPMDLVIAGGHEGYQVRAELAEAKTPVLLAPLTTTPGSGPEQTETVLNNAGMLHEAGVPIALTGGKLLDQARMAARFGLPKNVALAAITSQPAAILGLRQRVGSIAVGLDADLVALSGDPFDLATIIRWTSIDGVIRAEETN